MSRQMSSVLDINPGMKKPWTVLVQVVEIGHPQLSKTKNIEYRRLILSDTQGTLVHAIIFKGDFHYYTNFLLPYKRYHISNAVLSTYDSPYRFGTYKYSWILNSRTLVEGLVESIAPTLACRFDFTPFADLQKYADSDGSQNIRAVVLQCLPSQEHSSDTKSSTKRDIIIVNEEKKLMLLSLWNKFDEIEGNTLENMVESGPVLYGMRLRVTTFHSLSLSTRMSSGLMINPPTNEALIMKDWYNDNKVELQQLLEEKSYKNADILLPYPKDTDIVSVSKVSSSLDTFKTAWITGKITFPVQDRSCWYTVCGNCQKTLEADINWSVTCPSCKLETRVQAKSRITILIHDDSSSIRATVCSPEVEKLMPFTPGKLKHAEENDVDLHDEIAKAVNHHTIVAFIRSYESTFHGQPQTNTNVVKVYISKTDVPPKVVNPPTSSEISETSADLLQAGSSKVKDQIANPSPPSKPIKKKLFQNIQDTAHEPTTDHHAAKKAKQPTT